MRILFLSHYFPPESNAPANRVHALCKHWAAQGHSVQVITGTPNVPNGIVYEGYRNAWRKEEVIDEINVLRVWTYIAPNKGTVRRTFNYLSYMFSALFAALSFPCPDIIIATSPQFFCGWTGVIYHKLRKVPFVLEIRDIWPESIETVGAMKNRMALRLLESMEQAMYRTADHIVTVGEGYKRKLMEKKVPENKISVITNGVDTDRFEPRAPAEATKTRWGLKGKFVCSYVGTIGMACGMDIVLRAGAILQAQNHNDIAFLLVGDGARQSELKKEAEERMALKNVIFTGRMSKESIPDILSITDVCLVHLKKAGLFETVMPSKIFEAAGMAKPIIMGVQGEANKMVQDAGAGISIEPENENELVTAVLKLKNNPNECRTMGLSGMEYMRKHFDTNKLSSDYLNLLKQITGKTDEAKS